jgi:RHS repeat-associated protein
MLAAAQDERLALPNVWSDADVWSEAEIFSLAALSAVALETHVGANTRKGKKPHQGVAPQKSASHQGQPVCNSTTALGVSWWWESGTASGAGVTYDYDAFGNLTNSTGSTPNNYLFAGEQYDPALGLYYNRARYLNTTTDRFWSMDTQEPTPLDPMSLHRYLYADANPVDNVDPTGLYTQQFGYDVEAVVEPAYQSDYPTSNVSLGGWAKLPGAWRLKPDILDFTRNIWMEIKPLSISGITRAAASGGLYSAAFAPSGIYPDITWLQHGRIFTVVSGGTSYATLVFNCGGILFYTTNQDDYNLFNEIAQSALGFGIAGGVGALAGSLVNAVAGQGSEVQTINNLVQIGIKGGEAEVEIDTAVDIVPAA